MLQPNPGNLWDILQHSIFIANNSVVQKKYLVVSYFVKFVMYNQNNETVKVKVTKIYRVLEFKQSPWLKSYIDFNTQKKSHATTTFEKDFYKLKLKIENTRKRVNVKLVHTKRRLRKVCAKPNFQCFKIFNDDLVAVNL